ncbi:hypothetical protein [Domibacillus sp. 8LH]|uniref:hypothetical protein n=1 Tax=Domibacillus sp. 8LH TaxID=3073900 RepID=UPI00319E0A25
MELHTLFNINNTDALSMASAFSVSYLTKTSVSLTRNAAIRGGGKAQKSQPNKNWPYLYFIIFGEKTPTSTVR